MGANSNIEWTDHTFNPWIGCTKVSPGCAHCYAEQLMAVRYQRVEWGKGKKRVRTSAANWKLPLRWNETATLMHEVFNIPGTARNAVLGPVDRPRVFCASLADWLDEEVPIEWVADLLDLQRVCRHLDWLDLSKRLQNWRSRLEQAEQVALQRENLALASFIRAWLEGNAPDNIWLGTTVEDQQRADERIPVLLSIPARVRFLSCEPLLGPVDITAHRPRISETFESPLLLPDWVICGGESGPGARPALVEWYDDLRRQCASAGIPFFMKQLGAHVGTTNANAHDWPEQTTFVEVAGTPQAAGARVRLRSAKGGDIGEFPSELQVREFPK